MAQSRPITSAVSNFFSQFNQGQEINRRREQEENRVQAIIEAAEIKRQQELDDREDLALSIERSLGIDISDVPVKPTRQPQVEDTGIFPAPQRTDAAAGIVEEDITQGGITIPGSPTGAERRGPGRPADFTFTQKQRKAFSEAVAINPSVSAPILNFLTKANDFQLQQEGSRTARNLRGAIFLQDQLKKSPVLFQEGIRELVQSGIYGPEDVEELVELSNDTNDDLVNLKLEKLVLDNTPMKILLEEEVAKRKSARAEQVAIRTEARAEQTQIREEIRQPATPLTQIAKLNADFDRGLITAEQRDRGIEKATRERAPLVEVRAFEKESARLGARSDAAVRDEVKTNARSASRELSKVRSLSKILETADAGTFTQFAPQLARVIPFFDATNEQAAQAQISSFVLDQMAKFKGSTSERELDFARDTLQQLGNTPEANRIISRNLENVIFLASEENRQFDEFVKGGNKPRNFIFNFQKVIIPDHPTFGNVTLDDLQTTAFEIGFTIERTMKELRNK